MSQSFNSEFMPPGHSIGKYFSPYHLERGREATGLHGLAMVLLSRLIKTPKGFSYSIASAVAVILDLWEMVNFYPLPYPKQRVSFLRLRH